LNVSDVDDRTALPLVQQPARVADKTAPALTSNEATINTANLALRMAMLVNGGAAAWFQKGRLKCPPFGEGQSLS
jgi:hypothetical protein